MKVWTWEYNAFRLGGNPERAIATDVDEKTLALIEVGSGHSAYLMENPCVVPLWHLIEVVSGAIVGTGLTHDAVISQVRKDVSEAKPGVIIRQISDAVDIRNGAKVIDSDKFWGSFKAKKSHRGPTDRVSI